MIWCDVVRWWAGASGSLVGWCSIGMKKAHRLYRPMGYVVERPICVWLVARLLMLWWLYGGYRLSPIVYDGEPMP